jgi:hypothetical protein
MIELNDHGILSWVITLIEKVHFPDTTVTWTVRDIQNLLQGTCNRKQETRNFLKLLELKPKSRWLQAMDLNEETPRLEENFQAPRNT